MTRAALAVAPTSKLLYSSDGHSIPEHSWLGARRGRETVGTVLEEMVAACELLPSMAEDAGSGLLRENARRVYGLDDAVLTQPSNGYLLR
jgi:predicted TIM-barrel fold metal-dependent hydrolase